MVQSNADSRIHLEGTVQAIDPLVDPQTRQAIVKVEIPSSTLVKPGMFLQAAIRSGTAQGLTIPAKAFLPQTAGKGTVYLLQDRDTARVQMVEVGEINSATGGDLSTSRIEIKSGLKVGDRIIVDGVGYLKDGDKVQVVATPTIPRNNSSFTKPNP
ncbi:MAG: hypothetical protein NVS2B14_01310 [Chamaesiphon sp.]